LRNTGHRPFVVLCQKVSMTVSGFVVDEEQQAVEAIRPRDMQKHITATRMAQDDRCHYQKLLQGDQQLLQGETRGAPVRMLEPVVVKGFQSRNMRSRHRPSSINREGHGQAASHRKAPRMRAGNRSASRRGSVRSELERNRHRLSATVTAELGSNLACKTMRKRALAYRLR